MRLAQVASLWKAVFSTGGRQEMFYGFASYQLYPREKSHDPCFASSVAKLCPTLCDPVDCSIPGLPVLHHLLEFAQTHVH